MDRKSFIRIIPGLFAVKEIAKHLATLPATSPVAQANINRGLYYQIKQGNTVTYNKGNFSPETLQKVMGDLFYANELKDRGITIHTGQYGYEEFQKALDPSPMNRLRIGYNRFIRRFVRNS